MRYRTALTASLACLTAIVVSAFARAGEPAPKVVQKSKLSLVSNIDMDLGGRKQKMLGDTSLFYQWARTGKERALNFDAADVKVVLDGNPQMDVKMNASKVVNTQGGQTVVVPFADAPPELKTMLKDSFLAPICKIQIDDNGHEVKRTIVAGPGAESLIQQGMIANALLFHPPYFADKNEWEAEMTVSIGNGGYGKGKVLYKKVPGGKNGQNVQVSGTLTNDGYKAPGNPLTVKSKHIVVGEQTYDPTANEWIAGKLTMDVAMHMTANGQAVGAGNGVMNLTHQLIGAKK